MPGAWQLVFRSAQRRRRGIFVEPRTKKTNPSPASGILSHPMGEEQSPVGAAYSAPTELGLFFDFMFYKYASPTGFTPGR
jgi:hypothetical protein